MKQNTLFKILVLSLLMPILQNCGSSYEASSQAASVPEVETPSDDANPETPNEDTNEPSQNPFKVADLSFCDDTEQVQTGHLCAIQPSKTDSLIKDFARGSATTPGPGFGFHVIGVPADTQNIKGVWLHFAGSFGSPYQPKDGKFVSSTWMTEVLSQNYLVVGIAYDNEKSVNGDICGSQTSGVSIDNCAGLVREEILTGIDKTSLVNVTLNNGVYNRLSKLIAYLQKQGFAFPSSFQPQTIDWAHVRVSGHSQGAGHAYFMAKNVGVKSACFLGGPYDTADSVNIPTTYLIADWYLKAGSKTSAAQMGAFVVTTDTSYSYFIKAYDIIGLEKNQNWFEVSGDYTNAEGSPIDGHAASVGAPALADERAQACFSL